MGSDPTGSRRILNSAWAAVGTSGVASNYLVTLEVTGRKSGRTVSLPVVVAVVDGQRYLVSMLGEHVKWVHNVRAAGGRAVLRSGGCEEVHLEEVPARCACPHLEDVPAARPRSASPCAREQGCTHCGIRKGGRGLSGLPGGEHYPCISKSLSPSSARLGAACQVPSSDHQDAYAA